MKKALVVFLLAVVVIITLSAVPYLNQLLRGEVEKKLAEEYFEILDVHIIDGEFKDPPITEGGGPENSSILIVYWITFKLVAIGGEAHDVVIPAWGEAEPEYFETIPKGQNKTVELSSPRPFGYKIDKQDGKFPFSVQITCAEADGTINIYLL